MRCERAQAWMDRYLHEGLPPDEREALEGHLRVCRECQQQLAKLEGLLGALRSVPAPPVPEGFAGRVMARAQAMHDLRASRAASSWHVPRWKWRRRPAVGPLRRGQETRAERSRKSATESGTSEAGQGEVDRRSVARGIGTWRSRTGLGRSANAVAAVAAGLLLGLVLGEQTWRLAAGPRGVEQAASSADAEMVYSLDYLSVSPRGSFAESYLSLTVGAGDLE